MRNTVKRDDEDSDSDDAVEIRGSELKQNYAHIT